MNVINHVPSRPVRLLTKMRYHATGFSYMATALSIGDEAAQELLGITL